MDRIKNMFMESFQLNEMDEDDVFRDRTRSDGEAFESGLDAGSDAEDFGTDDLGFDPTAAQEDRFADAYAKVASMTAMVDELISPDDGKGSLLKLLAEMDRNDSIAKGIADKVRRDAKKASDSLSAIVNELKTVASMEPSLRRKLESLKSA